jgi:hypothetical protein
MARECFPDKSDAASIAIRETFEAEETAVYVVAKAREELLAL